MRCNFTTRSRNDLIEIAVFIAQDNPARAFSYTDEIEAFCHKVALSPKIRGIVANLEGVPLRKALFGNYQIYYAVLEDNGDVQGIEVVHIRHGARLRPKFQ